jgi:hypothetical protein
MWRLTIALLVAVVASETAGSADRALTHHRVHRAAVNLPAGLPRPHYNFRTTITYREPHAYRRPSPGLSVYEAPELMYAPVCADAPCITPLIGVPLLPGYSTLPGYYESSYPYDYQGGAYYGGPYVPYWDRLPYACGVYRYC